MLFKFPLEVKLEIAGQCNYGCSFCFNRGLSGKKGSLSSADLRKIIAKLASEGIRRIRFTGGEPLLRKDAVELMRFAKDCNLFVILNTNGSLLSQKNVPKIAKACDDVLVSLNAFDAAGEAKLQGTTLGKTFFEKKLAGIEQLLSENCFVRVSTVLSRQNIESLEKFVKLVDSMPAGQWVLLRPIPSIDSPKPMDGKGVAKAVEKIISINKGRKEKHLVENALPFCSYSPKRVASTALGAINEDGNSKLVVDLAGNVKPSYFFDLKLGNALQDSFSSAWNSDFMQRLHALEFIAEPCHKCRHLHKCRAGSRFAAFFAKKSLYALDPLADPNKFSAELFQNEINK